MAENGSLPDTPPAAGNAPTGDHRAPALPAGALVAGRYRILQKLGEGGFGVVYLAEQRAPVQREVALKIIKPGMDTDQVLARFEQERQALALMDHPHIAKVLDGGCTERGHPFFVMELVRGLPITRFCDEQKLTLRQRLELFIPVCQAIQHAHQKGIIHRDLKPSNILVSLQDGKPAPKVIDFGVAKALHRRLTERTLFTQIGILVGTPEYVSPEQAGVNALDIDTRSDIYSLGIVLYELLTGVTPIDKKRLRSAAYDEVLRMIREEEPSKPSTRITTLDELPSIAAQRKMEPQKLRRFLRGDLDWIVMKAVEKDRDRRYETANGLAMDVQRFLKDEPVLAGPPSAAYRVRKFLKRNRGAVLAAALAVVLLLAGMIGTTIGLARALQAEQLAERERERAEANFNQAKQAIDEFYTRFSKGLADQPGAHQVRKELLDTALKFYERFLEEHRQDAGLRAELAMTHWRIARIHEDLGEMALALGDFRKALALQEALVAEHPEVTKYREDLAATCNGLSMLASRQGQGPEAIRLIERALELRQQAVKELPDDLATLSDLAGGWNNLGVLLDEHGDPQKALAAHQKALEIRAELVRRKPNDSEALSELSKSHNNLGAWYWRVPDDAQAIHHYEQALRIRERLHKKSPQSVGITEELAKTHYNLALVHVRAKRTDEALRHGEAARELGEELVHGNPAVPAYRRSLASTLRGLGIALHASKRLPEAQAAFQRSYDLRAFLADEFPTNKQDQRDLAQAASNLGAILQKMDRFTEALVPAERAVSVYAALLKAAPDDFSLRASYAQACTNQGAICTDSGQPKAALDVLGKAIASYHELLQRKPGEPLWMDELAGALNNKALALQKLERWEESLAACTEAVALLKPLLEKNPASADYRSHLSENYFDLAKTQRRLGRPAKAVESALECQALWPKQPIYLYNVACELAQCAPLFGPAEQAERQLCADAAIAALRHAVASGYKNAAHMEKDADLDSLRGREDFKKLVAELKEKPEKREEP